VETAGQRSSVSAMKQALEALEKVIIAFGPGLTLQQRAITALRQALVDADDTSQERVDEIVKDEHEPVAWANSSDLQNFDMRVRTGPDLHHTVPLYTAPPKREWVGLTDEEVDYCRYAATFCDELDTAYMAELIEKDLKEKNT